ncbi:MAG: tetratricopeptide repeat protein [Pseudomonadota bacterium]
MSDDSFIREVEEELRSERLRSFWSQFGNYIIAAAVIIILAVAGTRYYQYTQAQEAAANGDAFMDAVRLAENEKRDEALAALSDIQENGPPAYQAMASLRAAAELAQKDDSAGALALYDQVIASANVDENLKAVARLRAGMLLVDTGTVKDVEDRVNALAAPGAPYRASAREALGLAYYKAGDLEKAFQQFDAILSDTESPSNVRERSTILLSLIASKGGPTRSN